MWKKTKLFLLSSTLAFSVTCGATNFVVSAAEETESSVTENINQNYLKIMFENKVLFHEQVPSKTIIQVLNAVDEVIESEVLSRDMELELESPKIGKGKMLSYWSIERKGNKLFIMPVLVLEKDLPVKFLTTEGGQLLKNNAQINEILKSVTKGTKLKDILPEVNPRDHHKFAGWSEVVTMEEGKKTEEKITDIDDRKIMNAQGQYHAKFFPDYNDNNIDDRTEKITVKVVTNSDEAFKDIATNVGKQFSLPKLKKKDHVFMGWYKDDEYKEKFTDDVFTESLTLYAKWEKVDKVITKAEKKPITDKDISDQVERILDERLRRNNNASQSPNNASQSPNNASQSPANQPKTSDSELVIEPIKPSYEGNTGSSFKETKYVFNNKKLGQEHMVKFFEKDGGFLFSLILPYGKTIKLYDENDSPHEEYTIRQDTTITLNTGDYINEGSIFLDFDTREVRVNSTQITEIFPKVDDFAKGELAYEQERLAVAALEKEDAKNKNMLFASVGGVIVAALIGLGAYLFIRRKRRMREQVIEKESA